MNQIYRWWLQGMCKTLFAGNFVLRQHWAPFGATDSKYIIIASARCSGECNCEALHQSGCIIGPASEWRSVGWSLTRSDISRSIADLLLSIQGIWLTKSSCLKGGAGFFCSSNHGLPIRKYCDNDVKPIISVPKNFYWQMNHIDGR